MAKLWLAFTSRKYPGFWGEFGDHSVMEGSPSGLIDFAKELTVLRSLYPAAHVEPVPLPNGHVGYLVAVVLANSGKRYRACMFETLEDVGHFIREIVAANERHWLETDIAHALPREQVGPRGFA